MAGDSRPQEGDVEAVPDVNNSESEQWTDSLAGNGTQ